MEARTQNQEEEMNGKEHSPNCCNQRQNNRDGISENRYLPFFKYRTSDEICRFKILDYGYIQYRISVKIIGYAIPTK